MSNLIYSTEGADSWYLIDGKIVPVNDDGFCGMTSVSLGLERCGVKGKSARTLFEEYHGFQAPQIIDSKYWADELFFLGAHGSGIKFVYTAILRQSLKF